MLHMTNWHSRGKKNCCKGKAAVSGMKRNFVLLALFHPLQGNTFPSHKGNILHMAKKKKKKASLRLWSNWSVLNKKECGPEAQRWFDLSQFFTKTKAPVHAAGKWVAGIFPSSCLRKPPSQRALDTQSSLALVLLQDKIAFSVCTKNSMHFSIKVSPEPDTLQSTYPSGFQQTLPIHSQWNRLYKCLSHLTSSTSQRFSDPFPQSYALHTDNLWFLLTQATAKY